jgi:hypothetical protein
MALYLVVSRVVSSSGDTLFIVVNCKRSIFFLLYFLLKLHTKGPKCEIWTHDYNVTAQYLLSFAQKPDANTDHIVRFCSGLAGTLSGAS